METIKNIKTLDQRGNTINSISDAQCEQHNRNLLEKRGSQYARDWRRYRWESDIKLDISNLERAIRTTKLRNAPEAGGIYDELIKCRPPKFWEKLRTLYEKCLNGAKMNDKHQQYYYITVISTIGWIYSRKLKR